MDPDLPELGLSLLKLGLNGLTGALVLAVCIGLLVKGPARWVKILAALMLLSFLTTVGVLLGLRQAIGFAGVLAGTAGGTMGIALLAWSQPRRRVLTPTEPASCPTHARARVDRWSTELLGLGFVFHSDQVWQWGFLGAPRNVFVRFFNHRSEPIRAEIHALDRPKMAVRVVTSLTRDGRTLVICDQQSDAEHFPSQAVKTLRVASGSTCERLVREHRVAAEGLESAVPTDDPVAAHLDSYHRWVEELVEGRVVAVRGGNIRIRLASMPGIVLRVLGAWLH